MNKEGGKVLRYYTLDTTGIKVDSILQWYRNVETYGTYLMLAKHYYFSADSGGFDNVWAEIPQRFPLSGVSLHQYNRLNTLYETIRNHVLGGQKLNALNAVQTEALQVFNDDCDEAAFIAKALLKRNGVEINPDCETAQSREDIGNLPVFAVNSSLTIVPNPAKNQVKILFPISDSKGTIKITDLLGRQVFSNSFIPQTQQLEVSITNWAAGVYIVTIHTGKFVFSGKLLVKH
jgi:hypothetical protein